jgi:hypothetical protein
VAVRPPRRVGRAVDQQHSPEQKTVVVNIEKKRIEESPVFDANAFDHRYELALQEHYGFPYTWPN